MPGMTPPVLPPHGIRALLADRAIRALVVAQWLFTTALGAVSVALPLLALEAGGGPLAAAIAYLPLVAPYIVLGLPVGLAVDRTNRRLALGVAMALAIVACALIASGLAGAVVAGSFALGIARVIDDAAITASFGDLAPGRPFAPSVGLITSAELGGGIIGAALVGLTGASSAPPVALGLCALAPLALVTAGPVPQRLAPRLDLARSLRSALGHLRGGRAGIAMAASLGWNLTASSMAVSQGLPALIEAGFVPGAAALAVSIGSGVGLTTAIVFPSLVARYGAGRLLAVGLAGAGLALALFGRLAGPAALGGYWALVALNRAVGSTGVALRQGSAPATERALVAAVSRSLTHGAFVAGSLAGSAAVERIGQAAWFATAGLACVGLALVVGPRLRSDSFSD